LVRFLNKTIDTRAPWALAKSRDPALAGVLYSMLLCLRAVEGLVRPIMPKTADAIASQLGLAPLLSWDDLGRADSMPPGARLGEPAPLFPRIDAKRTAAEAGRAASSTEKPNMSTQKPAEHPSAEIPGDLLSFEDFAKVQLRIARVLEAEPVEGADKLLKLQIMIGGDRRQIVAGIRNAYDPLDLIGRQIVVVANLRPAVVRGVESQGMLLAAVDEQGGAILLQPDRETPEGAKVR
jgi:methionyl-tRNA synthetase